MLRTPRHLFRLLRIARTLARHGALEPFEAALSGAGVAPAVIRAARLFSRPLVTVKGRPGERLAAALVQLGPAFIKFGQMLSTRADLIGEQNASDLSTLQDQLAPFPAAAARATIEQELGRPVEELFLTFDDQPISAASIAQVHLATIAPTDEIPNGEVAVKVLRPGIEAALARDIDLLRWLAEMTERTQPRLRRLKPVEVVDTFAETVKTEMDLRLEAAAAAELAANFAQDPTYLVPPIDWRLTARRVMTQQRIAGIPIDDRDAILAGGHNIREVLSKAAAIFFNQVFRDGYFHGDQHPGNMFVDAEGRIGVVDFGIMGRLDRATRFYLADMLLGFLNRDYRRVAEIHFDAGYVPPHQSLDSFAQACRSIGEPIFGRPLQEISFARVLGQLFQLAEGFEMEVQPQLLLLQKNMLMAEGVSRRLDPELNTWTLAQPLIEVWMRENRGPEARLKDALGDAVRIIRRLPYMADRFEQLVTSVSREGVRVDPESLARAGQGPGRSAIWALWIALAALAVLVLVKL
ncbi:MAG TPA: 2-polyprenylphenol 6-hydroxylase [Verrucomicrobiae bacterium]|nr:2-polyprenylphenol 6-hydroxylase [Verrucomicrobiae bacterium]